MKTRKGSIQTAYIPLKSVDESVLCLTDRQQPETISYRAILEVTGLNFALLTEQEQRQIFEEYQQLIASITFPIVTHIRIQPLDLAAYLAYLTVPDQAADQAEPWQNLAQSHAEFIQQLTLDRTLLERRFYVVIPADDSVSRERRVLQRKRQREQRQSMSLAQARQQLAMRCETISAGLENMGLHTRQIQGSEIIRLYDAVLGGAQRTKETGVTDAMIDAVNTPERSNLTLDDMVAPASIRVEPDYVCIDEQEFCAALALRGLPRSVAPGWLQRLILMDVVMDITLYQSPRTPQEAVRVLRRKEAQYKSASMYMQSSGRNPSPLLNLASQDISPLVESVATGDERLHDHAAHLLIRADSLELLDDRVHRVMDMLYTIAHYRPQKMLYEQERGLKIAIPGNMMSADSLLMESTSVATMIPFFSNLMYQPGETSLLEGITPQQEPVVINLWELENYNRFILASPGAGKSYKTKMDVERTYMMFMSKARRERKPPQDVFQIIVIDPEAEYVKLCRTFDGQWIRLSPGSGHHINPFDLPQRRMQRDAAAGLDKEDVLKNQIQRLHQFLDTMLAFHSPDNLDATLSVEEKALIDIALYETYRRVGITADRDTHRRQPPLLRDLYHVLESGDVGEDKTGLRQRLHRYVYGSLAGLFADYTNVELTNPIVVFDTKELETELQTVGLMMISNLIWNSSFASLIPRMLIIDELATLYQTRSGAKFAEDMFRRSRKQYLSITGITQNVDLFMESGIMSNCATHLLLKQSATKIDKVAELFKLSPKEAQLARSFKRGEALMLVDGKRMHVRFLASVAEDRLASTRPDELARWEQEEQAKQEEEQHAPQVIS